MLRVLPGESDQQLIATYDHLDIGLTPVDGLKSIRFDQLNYYIYYFDLIQ